jgi:hypothetical protein
MAVAFVRMEVVDTLVKSERASSEWAPRVENCTPERDIRGSQYTPLAVLAAQAV